jgi:PAS domain S-box-containing protein
VSEVSVLTYRHLVEGIPAVLYVDANDDRSSTLYTSPQIEPLLGFTVEQWRDDPALWVDRIHQDDRERVLEEHRESLRTGGPFRTEYRLLAADGREVWIRDEAVLVRGAEHDWASCGERCRTADSCSCGSRTHGRRSAGGSRPTSTTIRSR